MFLTTIFLSAVGIGSVSAVRAQEAGAEMATVQTGMIPTETPFVPTETQKSDLDVASTIPVPPEILASVIKTLQGRSADILPGSKLIITSLDESSGWALLTVAVQPSDPNVDILANSTLMIAQLAPGGWVSAILGTDAYEALLTETPASFVPAESKSLLSAMVTKPAPKAHGVVQKAGQNLPEQAQPYPQER